MLLAALALIGAGCVGVYLARGSNDDPRVRAGRKQVEQLGRQAGMDGTQSALEGNLPLVSIGAGGLLLVVTLLAGRIRLPSLPSRRRATAPETHERADLPRLDRRTERKVERLAHTLAKKGQVHEAAELCSESGALDAAADYFVEAGEFVRAAGIRHDQNRFLEAAELHL
jgi:hypothetical protein